MSCASEEEARCAIEFTTISQPKKSKFNAINVVGLANTVDPTLDEKFAKGLGEATPDIGTILLAETNAEGRVAILLAETNAEGRVDILDEVGPACNE